MNLDIQPNNITILINASSIAEAIHQLARAAAALQRFEEFDQPPAAPNQPPNEPSVEQANAPIGLPADTTATGQPIPAALPPLTELQSDLNQAGKDLFGVAWPQVSPWLVKRYTSKFTPTTTRDRLSKLTAAEVTDLLTRLVENAPTFQEEWRKAKVESEVAAYTQAKGAPARRPPRPKPLPTPVKIAAAQPSNVVMATG